MPRRLRLPATDETEETEMKRIYHPASAEWIALMPCDVIRTSDLSCESEGEDLKVFWDN